MERTSIMRFSKINATYKEEYYTKTSMSISYDSYTVHNCNVKH